MILSAFLPWYSKDIPRRLTDSSDRIRSTTVPRRVKRPLSPTLLSLSPQNLEQSQRQPHPQPPFTRCQQLMQVSVVFILWSRDGFGCTRNNVGPKPTKQQVAKHAFFKGENTVEQMADFLLLARMGAIHKTKYKTVQYILKSKLKYFMSLKTRSGKK